MTKKQKKDVPRRVREKFVSDGDAALERTADLVHKIVNVPKSELPTDSRKQPESEHG